MLPTAVPPAVTGAISRPITGVVSASVGNVILPVRIVYECVVIIYVDFVVASPTAVTAPAATPSSSHRHSNSEGNRHARGIVSGRRIRNRWVGIHRRTVNHSRLVAGDVDDFRVGLLNYDYLLIFDSLRFHLLLLGGFEVPLIFRLGAHAL